MSSWHFWALNSYSEGAILYDSTKRVMEWRDQSNHHDINNDFLKWLFLESRHWHSPFASIGRKDWSCLQGMFSFAMLNPVKRLNISIPTFPLYTEFRLIKHIGQNELSQFFWRSTLLLRLLEALEKCAHMIRNILNKKSNGNCKLWRV